MRSKNAMPYGRLLFTRGGSSYTCSASYVSDYSVAMTAGHCCYGYGQWAGNFAITLDYPTKTTVYYASKAWVSAAWQNKSVGAWAYDFCFFQMRTAGPGYLGWQTNPSASMLLCTQAFGYPANYGSTQQLYVATGGYVTKK